MRSDYLEELRANTNFLYVVTTITRAQIAGGVWRARCPFHETQECAMRINLESKKYQCDECGAGGDVFQFVCAALGLGRDAAAEWVAERNKEVIGRPDPVPDVASP